MLHTYVLLPLVRAQRKQRVTVHHKTARFCCVTVRLRQAVSSLASKTDLPDQNIVVEAHARLNAFLCPMTILSYDPISYPMSYPILSYASYVLCYPILSYSYAIASEAACTAPR
jgi:hypothetical protein